MLNTERLYTARKSGRLGVPLICIGLGLAGCDAMADAQMNDIKGQVAADAVARYEMARDHGGSPIDRCVQAGLVVAAYLQAGDQQNYTRWKATEAIDCLAAGVPR